MGLLVVVSLFLEVVIGGSPVMWAEVLLVFCGFWCLQLRCGSAVVVSSGILVMVVTTGVQWTRAPF